MKLYLIWWLRFSLRSKLVKELYTLDLQLKKSELKTTEVTKAIVKTVGGSVYIKE